jgi:amidase
MDVLRVLVPNIQAREPRLWVVSHDALAVCHPAVQTAMGSLLEKLLLPQQILSAGTLPLSAWANTYRVLAGAEIWNEHGQWIMEKGKHLAEDVRARFMSASRITFDEVKQEQVIRNTATQTLENLLVDDAIILMPTVPGPAPLCSSSADELATERQRVQQLVSAAGLAGLPQVSLPWMTIEGAPVGLSVIGARGNDGTVVQAARVLSKLVSSDKLV